METSWVGARTIRYMRSDPEISDVISKTRNMRYGYGVETVRDSTTLAAFEFPFVEKLECELSVRYMFKLSHIREHPPQA